MIGRSLYAGARRPKSSAAADGRSKVRTGYAAKPENRHGDAHGAAEDPASEVL